jgi:hypothetical protein
VDLLFHHALYQLYLSKAWLEHQDLKSFSGQPFIGYFLYIVQEEIAS